MKVYLAHNFEARDWLKVTIKPALEAVGHEVTSRWITDDSHLQTFDDDRSARADLEDIDKADVLILFTDQYGSRPPRGKFFEFGYAYADEKICILLGEDTKSSVFYRLENVHKYSLLTDVIEFLNLVDMLRRRGTKTYEAV